MGFSWSRACHEPAFAALSLFPRPMVKFVWYSSASFHWSRISTRDHLSILTSHYLHYTIDSIVSTLLRSSRHKNSPFSTHFAFSASMSPSVTAEIPRVLILSTWSFIRLTSGETTPAMWPVAAFKNQQQRLIYQRFTLSRQIHKHIGLLFNKLHDGFSLVRI